MQNYLQDELSLQVPTTERKIRRATGHKEHTCLGGEAWGLELLDHRDCIDRRDWACSTE